MSLVDPRYEAGEKIGKYIYYSHLDFNGLFRFDIELQENEFIRHFEDDLNIKKKHNNSLIVGNNIIFLPGISRYIDVFNYETFETKRIELNKYKNQGAITGSFCYFSNQLIICPFFLSPSTMELPFYQIDLDSCVVKERWDINEKVKKVCNHIGETCLWYGNKCGSKVYAVIYRTDKLIEIDFEKELVTKVISPVGDLYGVAAVGDDFWLITFHGLIVKSSLGKTTYVSKEENLKAFRFVEKYGDRIFLIPEFDKSVLCFDCSGNEKLKKYINLLFDGMDNTIRTISWYRIEKENMYLFSDRYSTLIKFNMKSGQYLKMDLKGKTVWKQQDERNFLNNILPSIYTESEQYALADFCSDISKM